MFFKIGILKNFAIFTRKHLCWSLYLTKLQTCRPVTYLKSNSNTVVFLWLLQILKNTNFEKHLRTAAFEIQWKCFLIHKIGIIILNLLWKTYSKCISLSNCNNIVVIRPTNKIAQIAGSTNNLAWCSKKMRASVPGKKTSSRSWACELDKGRSLWKINCSLWPCKDVSNKLLWFSWHNYIVVE